MKIAFVVQERTCSCGEPPEQKLVRPGVQRPAQACRQGQGGEPQPPLGCRAVAKVGRSIAQGNTARWGRARGLVGTTWEVQGQMNRRRLQSKPKAG